MSTKPFTQPVSPVCMYPPTGDARVVASIVHCLSSSNVRYYSNSKSVLVGDTTPLIGKFALEMFFRYETPRDGNQGSVMRRSRRQNISWLKVANALSNDFTKSSLCCSTPASKKEKESRGERRWWRRMIRAYRTALKETSQVV